MAFDQKNLHDLIKEGNALLERELFESAEKIFLTARKLFPEDASPLERLGRSSYLQKDLVQMTDRSFELIEHFPENIWGYTRAIDGLRDLGRFDEAKSVGMRMVKLFPNEFRPYGRLGRIAIVENDYESSLHWHQVIIDKFPHLAHGYQGKFQALFRLGRAEEAQKVIRLGKERVPGISFHAPELWAKMIAADQSIGHLIFDYSELNYEFWQFLLFIYESVSLQDFKAMLNLAIRFKYAQSTDFFFFLETLNNLISAVENDSLNAQTDKQVVEAVSKLAKGKCNLFILGHLVSFLNIGASESVAAVYEIVIKEYWDQIDSLDLSPEVIGINTEAIDSPDKKIWFIKYLSSAFYWLEGYSIYTTGHGNVANYKRSAGEAGLSQFDIRSMLALESYSYMDDAFEYGKNEQLNTIISQFQGNKTVTILFLSSLYKPFFPLWYSCHSKFGGDLVIVALDSVVHSELVSEYPELNIILFNVVSSESPVHPRWLWKLRLLVLYYILKAGHDALLLGVDTVLLKNPTQLLQNAGSEIVSIKRIGLKTLHICGDLVYAKSSKETCSLFRKTIQFYKISLNDQSAINAVIRLHGISVRTVDEDMNASSYDLSELGVRLSKLKSPIFIDDMDIAEDNKYADDIYFYFFFGELRMKLLNLNTLSERILAKVS